MGKIPKNPVFFLGGVPNAVGPALGCQMVFQVQLSWGASPARSDGVGARMQMTNIKCLRVGTPNVICSRVETKNMKNIKSSRVGTPNALCSRVETKNMTNIKG